MKFIKLLLVATFFVPLVLVSSRFIFPFVVPKILLFRSLVLLMFAGYILLLAVDWQKYRPSWTPINIAVACFFVSFAVSTFVGVDWYKSLWDNHERMLGLFTILHFVIFYFVITSTFKEWRDWRLLLRMFLFAGLIVMFIGLLQKFNPELLLNRGSGRVSATLGNAIYFSGYGLFLFFIGFLLAAKEPIRLRSLWFWYSIVGGIFGLLGIFFGQTRGTLLGLIVSVLVLLVGYLLTVRMAKKISLILTVLLLLSLTILGLLFVFRKSETVSQIPVLGSLLNSSFASATGQTRVMAWQIAVEAAKVKPIFGWGPNNYYYVFNKYYDPKFLEHGWGETWFDNAHSAIFNTLAVQGAIGLLAYVGLFLIPIIALWRGCRRGLVDKHLAVVGCAFLVAHFVHNAFVFENPTSYLYFFFFLAFVNSQTGDYKSRDVVQSKKGLPLVFVGIIIIVAFFLIYLTNINPARANMRALRGIQAAYLNPVGGLESYKKTISIQSPHIDDIRSDFARTISQIANQLLQTNQPQKIAELNNVIEFSYQELQKNFILHPLDIRLHLEMSQLGAMMFQLTRNSAYLFRSEKDLMEALRISPKRQQIQYVLSMVKLQLGKNDEAVSLLQDSIDNDPKIAEGWWRLAFVYKQINNNEKAKEVIAMAQNKGVQFDAQGQSVISMILAADKTNK